MCTAETDQTHRLAAHGEGDAVRRTVDQAERSKPLLAVSPAIIRHDNRLRVEPFKSAERETVFLTVLSVFVGIKLNSHIYVVPENLRTSKLSVAPGTLPTPKLIKL